MTDSKIIYTHTDEAPAPGHVLVPPIIQAYAATAGVAVETRDISLAGRILASFADRLPEEQRVDDALAELGELAKTARGQHHQAAQHQRLDPAAQGGDRRAPGAGLRPARTTPTTRRTDEEKDARARYDKVKGSAVNPVLREGNSDRRAPASVKSTPASTRTRWAPGRPDSKTNVAHMDADDFRSNEKSAVDRGRRLAADRARRRRRHHHRAPGVACRCWPARSSTPPSCASPRCGSSSPSRSPGPRPRACCSRCT